MVFAAMLVMSPQYCLHADAEEAFTESAETESEAEPTYTLDNIRDYVVGLNEPVELSDGTMRPAINFDNATGLGGEYLLKRLLPEIELFDYALP